jgi:mono/diheme cytochrome c family protein
MADGWTRFPKRRSAKASAERKDQMKLLLSAAIIVTAAAALRAAQPPPRSAKEGVYTTEQAARGKPVYDGKCASCHGTMATVTPDMARPNDSGFQNA